jgi:hypothetical protein
MTITDAPTTLTLPTTALAPVAFDLYRDIHKAIRVELFSMTTDAARLDPGDLAGRSALARHCADVVTFLVDHAEHEDGAIQPALEQHLPALAERVEVDHVALEARLVELRELADDAARPEVADPGHRIHRFHLAAASFTGAYLAHQDVEERVIMPALLDAVGIEAVLGIHGAILASIPPEEMGKSLALMFPAMNVDGRVELLGGMRAEAPAEVFQGVWGLAASVLDPCELDAVARRLGIG